MDDRMRTYHLSGIPPHVPWPFDDSEEKQDEWWAKYAIAQVRDGQRWRELSTEHVDYELRSRGIDAAAFTTRKAKLDRLAGDDDACDRLKSGKVYFRSERRRRALKESGQMLTSPATYVRVEDSSTSGAGFMDLPPEIRIEIYAHCNEELTPTNGPFHRLTRLVATGDNRIRFAKEYKGHMSLDPDHEPALLRTCHTIRREALPVYLSKQHYVYCELAISEMADLAARGRYERDIKRPTLTGSFLDRLGNWVIAIGGKHMSTLIVTLPVPRGQKGLVRLHLRGDRYNFDEHESVHHGTHSALHFGGLRTRLDAPATAVKECVKVLEKALGRKLEPSMWMVKEYKKALME